MIKSPQYRLKAVWMRDDANEEERIEFIRLQFKYRVWNIISIWITIHTYKNINSAKEAFHILEKEHI